MTIRGHLAYARESTHDQALVVFSFLEPRAQGRPFLQLPELRLDLGRDGVQDVLPLRIQIPKRPSSFHALCSSSAERLGSSFLGLLVLAHLGIELECRAPPILPENDSKMADCANGRIVVGEVVTGERKGFRQMGVEPGTAGTVHAAEKSSFRTTTPLNL